MRSVVRDALHLSGLLGMDGADQAVVGAALLAARVHFGEQFVAAGAIAGVREAAGLEGQHAALRQAGEWLADLDGDSGIDQAWSQIRKVDVDAIDWDAEAFRIIEMASGRGSVSGLAAPVARALAEYLAPPSEETCACLFNGSASLAWALAKTRSIWLFGAEPSVSRALALLAFAAGRQLNVDVRNPLDGSYSLPSDRPVDLRSSPIGPMDHLFTTPPFGLRVMVAGEKTPRPFEAIQAEHFSKLIRRSFASIVTDGLLFRESIAETDFRRDLATSGALEVISLPAGSFGRAVGVQSSLLRWRPQILGKAIFTNARTTEAELGLRPTDAALASHLRNVLFAGVPDRARTAEVSLEQLEENNFVLLPDRYVQSDRLRALEFVLSKHPTVQLEQIADVLRPKAPLPLRELARGHGVECLEVTPAELVDGRVTPPSREVVFSESEQRRIDAIRVLPGDILISIKGRVGRVGLVGPEASGVESIAPTPWVVSQSLAIIRLPDDHASSNCPTLSPSIIATLLSAPWVTEKLESLSGGTTLPMLSMSALKSLTLPLVDRMTMARVEAELGRIKSILEQIDSLKIESDEAWLSVWSQLWGMPSGSTELSLAGLDGRRERSK